jgi:hypothetical protein
MTLKERYKRFKAWQLNPFDWSFDENVLHHCENCGYDFAGKFCPACSQKAWLKKVSWKSVFQSTAEVWGMGNRSMLYSLWQLIWRPGFFISDYINGKRQVSFPPVKMLVVMGVISVVIDSLFGTKRAAVVASDASWVGHFFAWLESSPGWGWLIMTCFFILPTWCLFHYAPRNTKHTLPQARLTLPPELNISSAQPQSAPSRAISRRVTATCGLTSLAAPLVSNLPPQAYTSTQARNTSSDRNSTHAPASTRPAESVACLLFSTDYTFI